VDLDEKITELCSGGPSTEPCWWAPLQSRALFAPATRHANTELGYHRTA